MSRNRSICVCLMAFCLESLRPAAAAELANSAFTIQYGAAGVTSLRRTRDTLDTEYIAAGSALGRIVVRYRTVPIGDWREVRDVMMGTSVTAAGNRAADPAGGAAAIHYGLGRQQPTLAEISTSSGAANSGGRAALNDGLVPFANAGRGRGGRGRGGAGGRRGGPAEVASYSWPASTGEPQWIQYTFPQTEEVSRSSVFWTADGAPASWRLLYLDGLTWKPVEAKTPYGLEAGAFNAVDFAPVRTSSMRVEVTGASNAVVRLAEWRVGPDPKIAPPKELAIDQSFQLQGEAFDWKITLTNQTGREVEIGDLALPMRFAESTPGNAGNIYTQKLIRHSYVAGHGSWIYWARAGGVGPYLVMTMDGPTKFEYFDNAEGGFTPYIHAKAASVGPIDQAHEFGREQAWRLPITSLKLAPKGSPGSEMTYHLRFQWAPDFQGVRDALYAQNKIDTIVVPGMAIPIDLPAMIALRTKNKIEAVDPEFAGSTKVESIGEKGKDTHVYKITFNKLGENMLKVRYGDGQWMSLEFFVTEPLETLIKKRASFLVTHHQHMDPSQWWYTTYAEWDQKNLILRSPIDRDGLSAWITDANNDAGNARPAYIASKNVFFPNQKEIDSLEAYIHTYLWGKMQMTTAEKWPYALYGTPNWKVDRESADEGAGGRSHVWRIYDYPHIVMMYYYMYQITKHHPEMVHELDAAGYLERAYGTAKAYWTVPLETRNWSADEVPTMNESFIPELIATFEEEGKQEWANTIRGYWEGKVERFVSHTPRNLYGSEFSFDSTGFESTAALAHYAMDHAAKPGTPPDASLPATDFRRRVTPEAAKKFLELQMLLNVNDRGWLETTYFQLGSDYRGQMSYLLSYMSQMGGWGVLDYGMHFAKDPTDYLRLGYASALSSWALVNSGTEESGYGYWHPGKENDGATGGGFIPEAWGRGWIGKEMPRGAWYYSAEEDVGYCGALRAHATIVTDDPIFGAYAYGGILTRPQPGAVEVVPRDGPRTRLMVIRGDQRLHLTFDNDGFAREQPVTISDDLSRVDFKVENRGRGAHEAVARITGLPAGKYAVKVGDKTVATVSGGLTEQKVTLPVGAAPSTQVTLTRE